MLERIHQTQILVTETATKTRTYVRKKTSTYLLLLMYFQLVLDKIFTETIKNESQHNKYLKRRMRLLEAIDKCLESMKCNLKLAATFQNWDNAQVALTRDQWLITT